MSHPKITVSTPNGKFSGIVPYVISASRATDIPAFHTEWIMHRLRAGYCVWNNPFNFRQRQIVSFKNLKAIVFWSKNPKPLIKYLSEIDSMEIKYYFQFTINDYRLEKLEPGIPNLGQLIETFRELSLRCGREKVIWRLDPVIMGNGLTVNIILKRVEHILMELAPYTKKLIFSFLDMYKKTENNLKKINPGFRSPAKEEREEFAKGLIEINNRLQSPLIIASCAEKEKMQGIEHSRCIDPELLEQLCPGLYSKNKNPVEKQIPLPIMGHSCGNTYPKDKGQREACGCAPSKDIGRYNTCAHFCAYCYANSSRESVLRTMRTLNPVNESL